MSSDQSRPASPEGGTPPRARTRRALHAEDFPFVADAVRETLEGRGWEVDSVATYAAALAAVEGDAPYDVMIFDRQLGRADGLELVRLARSLPHRRQTPVIVFTATESESAAKEAGADVYLRKPYDVGALAETVARLAPAPRRD